jgi:hypothetical protein
MSRIIVALTSIVFVLGLSTSASRAQLDGVYEFDGGGDGTSWDDALNWERVTDPNGNPVSGNPGTPPDAITTADIPLTGVVIDNTMPGQTALDVNVGTAGGVGTLDISGGGLIVSRDLNVGGDSGFVGLNTGSLDMTGGLLDAGDDINVGVISAGQMVMSDGIAYTGDDFFVGLDSSLTMTGGSIDIGDRLVTSDNATILIDGGTVIIADDFFLFGDAQVTVDSGFMTVRDKLRFDPVEPPAAGKLTINGGGVRSEEYGLAGDGLGLIEINGDGVYQVLQSQLSIAQALLLIAEGIHITTGESAPLGLDATSVVVPEFFGNTNLTFTQIYIVDESYQFVDLALTNGWTGAPFGTSSPAAAVVDNVVHFKGAIANGTTSTAFTLPVEMRPAMNVYVPVDMCNATTGRLVILTTGVVQVQAENDFALAQCFTSLDGAKFVLSATGATTLALASGWVGGSFSTSVPAVASINGIVYLKGAMAGGTSSIPFTLPASMRPSTPVWLYTNLFQATKGRLYVTTSGTAGVVPFVAGGDAPLFTSLDGLSYDPDATGSTPLTLSNGWVGGSFGASAPAATRIKGIVHLMGAIENGFSGPAFTLPLELRPENTAFVPVDLNLGTKGRLVIQPTGSVTVQAEIDFADAQSFTSLDGASYAVPEPWGAPPLLAGLLLLVGLAASKARCEHSGPEAAGLDRAA